MNQIVIDATGGILGRIASYAAKQSLLGKIVFVVNCDSALLTGRTKMIVEEYGEQYRRGGASLKGPIHHKVSEKLVKRTIRGMLSYQQGRGHDAFKRIKCYNKVPRELESAEKYMMVRELKSKTMKVKELISRL